MTAGPAASTAPRDHPSEKNSQRWYPKDPSPKTGRQVRLRLMFGPLPDGPTRCATSLSTEESPIFSGRWNVRTQRQESAWLEAAFPDTNLHDSKSTHRLTQRAQTFRRIKGHALPGVWEGCRGGGLHSATPILNGGTHQETKPRYKKETGYLDRRRDRSLGFGTKLEKGGVVLHLGQNTGKDT